MPFGAVADPLYARGLREFRAGHFFEAHEEWERLWKKASGDDRLFLQGLIQLAAALFHFERRRPAPAMRLLRLARGKLAGYPDHHGGLPLDSLRDLLDARLERRCEPADIRALAEVFGRPQSKEGT
jgi:predicted metal-dependent hydrolase